MPLNFTVLWDDGTNDQDGTNGDIAEQAVTGEVRFEPLFSSGSRVLAPQYSPRPKSFHMRTFFGYMDTDGRLKNQRGGTVGARLWANDPEFGLESLPYKVSASLTDAIGRTIPFTPFIFEAPDEDTEVNLTTVIPVPHAQGVGLTRGPRGYTVYAVPENPDDPEPTLYQWTEDVTGEPIGDPQVLAVYDLGSIDGGSPSGTDDFQVDGGTP
jgi:hypothetical protein